MTLQLQSCTLRPWQEGDEQSLSYHANNLNIWNNMRDMFPHPYTIEKATWWVQEGSQIKGTFNLAIEVEGKAIGGIGLIFKEDVYRRTAEIGYWLGEEYRGKGIMSEALRAFTDYAFANFDLARIYASVFESNIASMRVLEKAGYRFEARLRKNITKNGQTFDDLIYAVVHE